MNVPLGSISPVPRYVNPMCLTSSSANDAVMQSRRFAAQTEPAPFPASDSVTDFGLGGGWVPFELGLDPYWQDNQNAGASLGNKCGGPMLPETCVLFKPIAGGWGMLFST